MSNKINTAIKPPDRIYIEDFVSELSETYHIEHYKNDIEYIRKEVVDDMLATAEDHAYFAGSEKAREDVTKEVCEWLKDAQRFVLQTPQYNYFDYKKAIESLRNTLNK